MAWQHANKAANASGPLARGQRLLLRLISGTRFCRNHFGPRLADEVHRDIPTRQLSAAVMRRDTEISCLCNYQSKQINYRARSRSTLKSDLDWVLKEALLVKVGVKSDDSNVGIISFMLQREHYREFGNYNRKTRGRDFLEDVNYAHRIAVSVLNGGFAGEKQESAHKFSPAISVCES
jgi:hypothetical protein